MSSLRAIELACGAATFLLGMLVPFNLKGARSIPPEYYWSDLISIAVIFALPGLIVAIGAYVHAVMEKTWGRKLLWVMGGLNVLIIPLFFLSAAYMGGMRMALTITAPSVMAIVTLLVSLKVATPDRFR